MFLILVDRALSMEAETKENNTRKSLAIRIVATIDRSRVFIILGSARFRETARFIYYYVLVPSASAEVGR